MPMIAVRIGRPIAITEPNAMSSTMIAARMPMISLAGHRGVTEPVAGELDLHAVLGQGRGERFDLLAIAAGLVPGLCTAVVIGATAIV